MITPLCVQLLYGLLGPLNKAAISQVPFTLYVGLKLTMAGSVLLAYHSMVAKKPLRLMPGQWIYYLQMILFGAIVSQLLKYWGLQYVSASKAAFLFNSAPFFVAFFSWVRWREQLYAVQWIGLCVSFVGLIPILVATTPAEEIFGSWFFISLPECAILCAAAAYAISFTAKRVVVGEDGYAPARVNGIYFCAGGLWSLGSWVAMGMPSAACAVSVAFGYAAVATLLGKVLCSSIMLYLLRSYSATFLCFMDYWYPLCVAFWSWLLWGEVLSYHYWISAAIIFCGQLLFYLPILFAPKK